MADKKKSGSSGGGPVLLMMLALVAVMAWMVASHQTRFKENLPSVSVGSSGVRALADGDGTDRRKTWVDMTLDKANSLRPAEEKAGGLHR